MKWQVEFTNQSHKQVLGLPMKIQYIVSQVYKDLVSQGPIPKYWDVKKTGDNEYRIRLTYRYRMRYFVYTGTILIKIFYVGHRKDAY